MVTKDTAETSKIKIDKLEVNKETVQDLTDAEAEKIKGGALSIIGVCEAKPSPYNSNGCGANYSFRGQQTCDPGTTNPVNPKGTING